MSVHQLKDDGRWICKFPPGTIPAAPKKTKEYFGRGPDAERAAHELNDKLGLGKQKRQVSPRFTDLAIAYLEAKQGIIAASTEARWKVRMGKTVLPAFGNIMTHEITPEYLDRYVVTRLKTVKRNSVHRELTDVRSILRWAVKRKLLATNPMEGFEMPKNDDARIRPPSKEEIEAILANSAPHLRRVILISYFTGLRPGCAELFGLEWSTVDLIGRTITIASAKKGGLVERTIPLGESFAAMLANWYREDEKIGARYLIHYNGKRVNTVIFAWAKAKKRAGITRRLRLYDLRHRFATTLLENGADLKSVSQLLGHKTVLMTLQCYQHVSSDLKRQAISMLDDIGYLSTQETPRKPA